MGGGVTDGFLHKFFVANVNVNDDGSLNVNVNKLANDNVWNAEYQHRVVVRNLLFLSSQRVRVFVGLGYY